MKVLHLISGGDTGGAKTHVLSLLADLNKDIRADLVCYMEGDFSREAREKGIATTVIGGGFAAAKAPTRDIIRRGGYDLVHCHGSRANLMGSLLKKDFDIPFISTVHSDYRLDYLGRPAARMSYGVLNAMSLRNMDYRVCVSDEMRRTLISRGFEPNRLFTIYNGVSFSAEIPAVSREEWLRRIGCDFAADCVVVGIAARLDPVKDVATLLRGFAEAAKENGRLRLIIAGDGQEGEKLKALSRELQIADKVFFAGWRSDVVPGFYSAIDINVISSLSETFPYAVTEAARAGVPTVCTRVGGLPVLIRQGVTGMLFEPGDHETLGKELLELSESEEKRKRLGKAVYEKAKRDFSAEHTCRRQLEIYETVIKRHKNQRAKTRDAVVICGAYGHGNAGDEAILAALIRQMRSLDRDMLISVISKNPEHTALEHGVNAIARSDAPGIDRAFKNAKLYINGGGSLIQDITSRRSLWFYLYTIKRARALGCRVLMCGCGIGPINYEKDRELSASVMDSCVDAITLRDPDSEALLRELGVTKPEIILAADAVLSTPPCEDAEAEEFMRENGLDPDGDYICLGLRPWTGFEEKSDEIGKALVWAKEKLGLTPVFLPMNYHMDRSASETVAKKSGLDCVILPDINDAALAIGVMKRMKLAVSMRLHSLLYAACGGTPTVGLSYDPKVTGFADYMGSLSLDFEGLTAEALEKCIEEACGSDRRAEYNKSLEKLKAAEKKNLEAAKRLLSAE